jgi:hypothetical protein
MNCFKINNYSSFQSPVRAFAIMSSEEWPMSGLVSTIHEDEKDLEIMLLRQQLRMAERKQPRGPHLPRWQKVPLVALVMQLKGKTAQDREKLEESVLLFKPDTVLGWHRAIVRWKWTFKQRLQAAGRPRTQADIEALVVQLARENSRWGYDRIAGLSIHSENLPLHIHF